MIAQLITFQQQTCGLLCAQPNWETEVKITLDLPTDITKEPITFTESRRAFAQSARYTMEWTAYMPTAADAAELRIFLTRIRGEPILVPMWPDLCELQNNVPRGGTQIALTDLPARFGSSWIIANDDFSSWEIVTVAALNFNTRVAVLQIGTRNAWPSGSVMYPLMQGRLPDRPKPDQITDESFEVSLKVKESSAFSARLSPPPGALPLVGPKISEFQYTPLFIFEPNFSKPVDWTEQPDIIYETVGMLRQDQQRVYDHRTPRGTQLEFYQNERITIGLIEQFWRAMRGPVLRFMIPTWRGDMRLRADTPVAGHPTWINVEDNEFCDPGREPQPGDPYIALIDSNVAIDCRRLTGANGVEGQMRVVANTNISVHSQATTILSNLLLARFQEPSLEWTYITPWHATTQIKFVELPHEYANPPDPLPEPAYLFIFTESGVRTDRFTSYENTIMIPSGAYAGTYVPAPFSFDTLKVGLKLDQEKLDFKSFKFTGNPLNKMWPFALDGVLTLEIVEAVATNPQSATCISRYYGDVWSVDSDYKATAISFGNFFERKFPRFLYQVSDNYVQFSPPTQLNAAQFKVTATIPVANHTSQTLVISGVIAHAKPADWFAGGWLETGTGSNFERRGILSSAPASGTSVTLYIDRPLLKAVNNQSIDLYPGYDGSIDQCDTKFHNRPNFGGHPYIPDVNPAITTQTQAPTGGKL